MPLERQSAHHDREHENSPSVQMERIPTEILDYPHWVCWRYISRGAGKKPDKQPVNPRNLHNAGVHWRNTWSSSEEAYTCYLEHAGYGINGVGFVLTKSDPFVGVDVDNCIEEGKLLTPAQNVVHYLRSYTEVSPSGQGLHILVACPEFDHNTRAESLEIYSHSRFLTVTGQHVADTPDTISAVQRQDLQSLFAQPPQETHPSHESKTNRINQGGDANTLWQRIFQHDKYGPQHVRRFNGDLSLDRGDHSYAVIRLLNAAARWTEGDAQRMREMMLMSPLANEKWFSKRGKGDWLDHQIADAIAFVKRGK